ncbi:MAG: DNA mismatch repair protein MutS [Lachnospiraceae bacterium]
MAKLTPMMEQYFEIKNKNKDCIIFYRLGDFYEMFFDDAILCSKELEITLTGRDCGQEERAPMCGVPYHSYETYLNKLVDKGYKVAICEQVEDPKQAKGLVKRDIIRIVTPGTNISEQAIEDGRNHYLMSVYYEENIIGIANVDVSTGDFTVTQVGTISSLRDEIFKYEPSEIICNQSLLMSGLDVTLLRDKYHVSVTALDSYYYDETNCVNSIKRQFGVMNLDGLGISEYPDGMIASGVMLQYLHETQKNALVHLKSIRFYTSDEYMLIDSTTRRNLELCETLREKQKRGSLLWVLDKTKTAMGARMLRSFIEQPLLDKEKIESRLDAVENLKDDMILREEIREYLSPVYDLERLMTKVSYCSANPRDLIAFATSLYQLPSIKLLLAGAKSSELLQLHDELDVLDDIYTLIDQSIVEEPPINIKEGGLIKDGFHEEIDQLKRAQTDGKTWLAEFEAREQEKTGIKKLRVKYNKIFGYCIEVTNSFKDMVPDTYIRKQTLAGSERYTTQELNELASMILGAEEKLARLEYEVFVSVREQIYQNISRVQQTARVIAYLDAYASMAYVAERNHYCRPQINKRGVLDIKDGRHPVVEAMLDSDQFVANDTYLDNKNSRVSIITGPNMAGKSTYMRQSALIVLMAQIGSFVPAAEANIALVDRIFARVGASDDLASGQSTFMVEMSEVANILRNATKNSLIIFDEIGRGTSTFDGLSIAWAVVEYISNPKIIGAKTLFATHYHELTELEGKLPCVNNYCIAVKEHGDSITFLRKIIKGGADKSYGVQVAKLAGVPDPVIQRAKELLAELSDNDITYKAKGLQISDMDRYHGEPEQITLFDLPKEASPEYKILNKILDTDVLNLTPMEAMNLLFQIQGEIKEL